VDSVADGFGMGFGFTLSLVVLGAIREILGNGTLFGLSAFGPGYFPFLVMILPPGAFITLGFLLALMNRLADQRPS
jgi:electron transport complex protein RnfE